MVHKIFGTEMVWPRVTYDKALWTSKKIGPVGAKLKEDSWGRRHKAGRRLQEIDVFILHVTVFCASL